MRKLLSLIVLLSLGANAQPPPDKAKAETVVIRAELVQATDAGLDGLGGKSLVPEGYWGRAERGRVLQTLELMTVTPKDALLVFGHKSPLVYYDPRSSQFQVQYVDTGCKLDIKVSQEGGGTYYVESRAEFSQPDRQRIYGTPPGPTASYPQVQVVIPYVVLSGVRPGQSYLVTRTDDASTRKWLDTLGIKGGSDRLAVVITLERPQEGAQP